MQIKSISSRRMLEMAFFLLMCTSVLAVLAIPLRVFADGPLADEAFESSSGDKKAERDKSARHFSDFNHGWGPMMRELEKSLSPDKDYITWLIEEPPFPMDLRTADNFRRSMLSSDLSDDLLGHMMIAWSCHDENGERLLGGAAQTGADDKQVRKMILSGWGETTFWAVHPDGYLDTPNNINNIVKEASQKNLNVAHVTFEVPRAHCQNMLKFFQSYLKSPIRPYRFFGLNLEPLKLQGGGCGSFASAMLTKGDVLPSIHSHLWRELHGTLSMMGGNLQLPSKVFLRLPKKYIDRFNYVWPGDMELLPWIPEDGPKIRMVDPEMGILAMRQIALEYTRETRQSPSTLDTTGFNQRYIKFGSWFGSFDRTSLAVDRGSGSYSEMQIPITENFDDRASLVTEATRADLAEFKKQGLKITPVMVGKYSGFLLAH